MLRSTILLGALLLAMSATAVEKPEPKLEELWKVSGLGNPESVAAASGGFLYVSNVAGEGDARDGNGFISLATEEGKLLEREWIKGLDAPKGLVLHGSTLYVADVTRIVEVDVEQSKIARSHDVDGAGFLNDIALAPDGAVLASDSDKSRISALHADGRIDVFLEDEQLRSVNGLLPERDRLIVTTMQGKLLAVDWKERTITVLAEGLGNADGVVRLDDGSYLVGEWPGRLFHVRSDGSNTVLIDSREAKTYLNDFLRVGDTLFVPNWEPSTLTAYRIRQ